MIHTAAGLTEEERERVMTLARPEFAGGAPPADLMRRAGFSVVHYEDITTEFRATCASILQARGALEADLRADEGDEAYEQELDKKRRMLEAIDAGLLVRSAVVGIKS